MISQRNHGFTIGKHKIFAQLVYETSGIKKKPYQQD